MIPNPIYRLYRANCELLAFEVAISGPEHTLDKPGRILPCLLLIIYFRPFIVILDNHIARTL